MTREDLNKKARNREERKRGGKIVEREKRKEREEGEWKAKESVP